MENYADLLFQGAVAELQKAEGSFEKYQKLYPHRTQDGLREQDKAFIRERDSFYIASTSPDGWPYIQHRGGPRGFLSIIGDTKLACLDYRGNQQFITMGHLTTDSRVSLFLMDYMNSARLKIQGHASLVSLADADPALVRQLAPEGTTAERVLSIEITALDWNCPQYIPQLYPADVVQNVIGRRIGALEAENTALKARLAELGQE
ncbi:pyridoxamine 5'-phosphate oxidase family protein [Roseovarius sp. 2305UL8-3]|uniref:pyridoxamine 5'-phosphate oxidase family protein n=1 Tax=Roseovarius conchicola TaxID=3121636 RepID=UPI003528881F